MKTLLKIGIIYGITLSLVMVFLTANSYDNISLNVYAASTDTADSITERNLYNPNSSSRSDNGYLKNDGSIQTHSLYCASGLYTHCPHNFSLIVVGR